VDLGDLSLSAYSRSDAEVRMKTRVLELGGDTLLFGERGRSGRLNNVPEEIVERRNELLAIAATAAPRRPVAASGTDPSVGGPGELWYYGAALRCNR
jgi:hypothetical protein